MLSMKQTSFELFLDRLDPGSRAGQLAFFRATLEEGPAAVQELAGRVQRVSCPAGLRQLTLEFCHYHPWPEWLPVVERLLRHEKELPLFETGVRALGRMRMPAAVAALRALSQSRATPGFREAVDRALREADPAEAFHHHFARLLQGSAQPADANEGAHQLLKLLTPESLEPLKSAVAHADPLVFRHALRLVGQIGTPEAAAFLLGHLKAIHQDALEDRELRLLLVALRALPRPELLERIHQALASRWGTERPEVLAELASGQADRVQAAADGLRAQGLGLRDGFLLDTLLAAMEEKAAPLTRHLDQANEAAPHRARRIEFGLDTAAQSLAAMAQQGLIEPEALLPALAEPLRLNTGRAGVASALARLVPPSAQPLLDLLLDEADGTIRAAALEILGERKDPDLRPALLKARRDAIEDLAQRALWHLGQLPDPEGTARAFLAEADPEEVKVGLRFAAMHRLEALVPDLLALAASESREAVQVAALEALGAIASPRAVDPLLALLHTGQAPRMRLALAEALRDLGDPIGALALSVKAEELKAPLLHAVAVEALVRAHDGPDRPLSLGGSAALLKAVQGGWSDRHPWPLRRRIADALLALHSDDPAVWAELSALVQATLGEKRPPGSVPAEDLAHLQTCGRVLAQKAQA
ncbi:MAG TPA: HEAT repeat domain-containing protein [Geothrix sp.]|nr:HEAT repeat domain-containing protein [Geothrix sp.]